MSAPLKDKKRFDAKRMQAEELNRSFHSSDEEAELDKIAEKEEFENLLRQMKGNKGKVGAFETSGKDADGKALDREEQLRKMGRLA